MENLDKIKLNGNTKFRIKNWTLYESDAKDIFKLYESKERDDYVITGIKFNTGYENDPTNFNIEITSHKILKNYNVDINSKETDYISADQLFGQLVYSQNGNINKYGTYKLFCGNLGRGPHRLITKLGFQSAYEPVTEYGQIQIRFIIHYKDYNPQIGRLTNVKEDVGHAFTGEGNNQISFEWKDGEQEISKFEMLFPNGLLTTNPPSPISMISFISDNDKKSLSVEIATHYKDIILNNNQ